MDAGEEAPEDLSIEPEEKTRKRPSWKHCKLCKSLVPVQYMAIRTIPTSHGYWRPGDADWCARCAENRSEGTKDEDGVHKKIQKPYYKRLDEGFDRLFEDGSFGDVVTI